MTDLPKAYQDGFIEFYKLRFKVTPDVLIPRPETELLVDEVLNLLSKLPTTDYKLPTILDLGTGSGAIAISLAVHLPGVKIIAIDVSKEALKIAKLNAKLHGVAKQIKFIQSNLLDNPLLQVTNSQLPIIVTNLPYIPSERIPYLDSSVKDFEPKIALNGGFDGFDLYRELFIQINQKNLQPKLLIGEIDYTHGELALNEAQKYFPGAKIEIKLDLAHKQRILIIKF